MTTKINIQEEILAEINKLSTSQLNEVLQFIININLSNNSNSINGEKSIETKNKKHRVGILKGTFNLPLPDDFDQPLEDMEEYM